MSIDLLLGLQWGDEGKGKIVDVLTKNYDIIARFQEDLMQDILSNSMAFLTYYTLFLQGYFILQH